MHRYPEKVKQIMHNTISIFQKKSQCLLGWDVIFFWFHQKHVTVMF